MTLQILMGVKMDIFMLQVIHAQTERNSKVTGKRRRVVKTITQIPEKLMLEDIPA